MSEIDCDAAAEAAGYDYAMDCLKEEMEELRKDAKRYRFIRAIAAGDPVEFGLIDDAAYVAHYGHPQQFDFNIDQLISAHPEAK